jgi:hypothetical protein
LCNRRRHRVALASRYGARHRARMNWRHRQAFLRTLPTLTSE